MTNVVNPATRPSTGALFRGFAVAAVGSSIAVAVVAVIARALGASDQFQPLQPAIYIPLAVIGVLVASIVWFSIVRRAAHSRTILSRLVPTVLVLSLIPDVAVGISGSQPGTSWGAVVALMLMHLAVAAVTVPALQRFVPAHD